jgi:hypothetical protein
MIPSWVLSRYALLRRLYPMRGSRRKEGSVDLICEEDKSENIGYQVRKLC